MNREIVRDIFFLKQKSVPAKAADAQTAQDLLDTLAANREHCVGLAANMIGECKRILVYDDDGTPALMLNPEIIKKSEPYETEEGCLSLEGTRCVTRYRSIKVRWQTVDMKPRIKTFTGFTAQIIQHEIDHFEGIII